MVQITVHVRPRDGYTHPGRIKTIAVDTSIRLEKLVADLKLDTSKGIALYSQGGRQELSLNTSLASNNVQPGDILETCACPKIAAALSVALREMEGVQKLADEDRTQERLTAIIGTIDPWQPGKWGHEDVKSRIICMALMKKLIQRQDRFAQEIVPQCTTLLELYDFLRTTPAFSESYPGNRRYHNSMAHLFKPTTSRDGRPTTVWQLLQNKLNRLQQTESSALIRDAPATLVKCPVDEFLATEKQRLDTLMGVSTPSTSTGRRKTPPSSSPQARKRRRIVIESPSARLQDKEWKCSTCTIADATCMCLVDDCPFSKMLSCAACFSANHPILQRNHQRSSLTDPQAKAVLKSLHRQDQQDLYCPQFASGPFTILCTLYDQAQKGQYSLSESSLKELAQPICRSNLYDHQAQGRNAFACIEGLMEKKLVRKEHVLRADDEGIFSLLPDGETLAKYCHCFQKRVDALLGSTSSTLDGIPARNVNPITMVVDTREDREYTRRLNRLCQLQGVPHESRELPAGDYLFLAPSEMVCPIIIERKSWSDLADSVLGKGKEQRRLDCVAIGNSAGKCGNGRCQLCKMKGSGCGKVMFIVEGARCQNREEAPNQCTEERRCLFCREIQQRHGHHVVHETLEEVLLKLQVQYGCLVHFTRSYDETITALLTIRDILGKNMTSMPAGAEDDGLSLAIALSLGGAVETDNRAKLSSHEVPNLSYDQFCKNARRKGDASVAQSLVRPCIEEWTDSYMVTQVFNGSIQASIDHFGTSKRFGESQSSSPVVDLTKTFNAVPDSMKVQSVESVKKRASKEKRKIQPLARPTNTEVIVVDSDNESTSSVEVLDATPKKTTTTNVLNTSDDDVQVIDTPMAKPPRFIARNGSSYGRPPRQASTKTTLLLMNGLYQYDMEFYKDLSAIWKGLFQNHISTSGSSVDGFNELCTSQLSQFHDSPLVHRNTIMFWLLYLQLRNVQIHVTRESAKVKQQCRVLFQLKPTTNLPGENLLARRTPRGVHQGNTTQASASETVRNNPQFRQRPPLVRGENDRERVRLARLARFDKPPPGPPRARLVTDESAQPAVASDTWACSECTLENPQVFDRCEACDRPRSGQWQCKHCTLVNTFDTTRCTACGEESSIGVQSGGFVPRQSVVGHSYSASTPFTSSARRLGAATEGSRPSSTQRKIKCGACGQQGHNRASATPVNCSRFYDPAEVAMRNKKREQKEKEAREASERIARHQRENVDVASKVEQAERALADLKQAAASDGTLRENEIRRLERQKKRAEKQANKYR